MILMYVGSAESKCQIIKIMWIKKIPTHIKLVKIEK